ncbi:MAG: hypothetical protein ACFE0Q_20790 [Anaerolineae bacterium]
MDGVVEGRMVHYVLQKDDSERSEGEHRPAVIVQNWSGGTVNLQVFMDTDGKGDYNDGQVPSLLWVTSATFDNVDKHPGTWHWIERVPPEVRTENDYAD